MVDTRTGSAAQPDAETGRFEAVDHIVSMAGNSRFVPPKVKGGEPADMWLLEISEVNVAGDISMDEEDLQVGAASRVSISSTSSPALPYRGSHQLSRLGAGAAQLVGCWLWLRCTDTSQPCAPIPQAVWFSRITV